MQRKQHVALFVNGNRIEAYIDVRMTLAEFLREDLGLTGTKVGCNRGECGSCTVILNGIAVYSCSILAVEAAGCKVLTIEGLEGITENGKIHPLQQAFMDHDALQCGYCTPGMIMSLKALLDKNPNPTEEDTRIAIDGHICRCGCYPNIIEATITASKKMGP